LVTPARTTAGTTIRVAQRGTLRRRIWRPSLRMTNTLKRDGLDTGGKGSKTDARPIAL
jgi:hypothetical protein